MASSLYIFLFTLVTSLLTVKGQVLVIDNIRLVNTNNNSYGTVEVQISGSWGTVCDDQWDDNDASVVCRMLGFNNGGQGVRNAAFNRGSGVVYLDEVACIGDESSLADCQQSPSVGNTDCSHNEDAGVICNPSNVQPVTTTPVTTIRPIGPQPGNCNQQNSLVRLIAPAGIRGIGLVEVFNAGVWGSVCDDFFDERAAIVVCGMLCYNTTLSRPGAPQEVIRDINASPIIVDNVRCTGNEARLQDCPHNPWNNHDCGPREIASVTCVDLNYNPPPPPAPILQCTEGYLNALFNRSRDRYLEEKHLTVASPGPLCNPIKNTDENYITIRIPFEQCGTRVETNATHLIYSNTINYAVTHFDGNKIRVNSYPVSVYCDMPRNLQADRDLEPQTVAVTQRAEGRFIINMTFYRQNSFDVPVDQYPVKLPLGEWLNVALTLQSVDSRLILVVPDCVATPTQDRNDQTRYPLFENNCPVESSLGFFPLSGIKFGFRYQPFMFVNRTLVYVHCGAFVCLVDETSAECDRSCNTTKPSATGRKKRSVHDNLSRQKYYIDSGPLLLYQPSNIETVIERVDSITYSTTVNIPLSSELEKELRKTTSQSSTMKESTKKSFESKTTTQASRVDSPSEMPTKANIIDETTPSNKQPQGIWIEYPRRSNTIQNVTDKNIKQTSISDRSYFALGAGINSASHIDQTYILFTIIIYLCIR